MEYGISSTVSSDLSRIRELNEMALPAVNSIPIEDFNHFLDVADYFKSIFIADKLVGYLIALQPKRDYDSVNYKYFEANYDSFMYVDRIVIDSNYQGMGLGKLFYDDLSQFTRGRAPIITCEVNIHPPNQKSIAFHKHYGFKQVDTQLSEGGVKEVSLMVLDL